MELLVSVVDAGEARAAAAAGADIVDVKNPAEGSLGAPLPAVIAAVRDAVGAERPVSAAIGDMPNLPGTAALAALGAARSGATFVKVGLYGSSTEDDAVALLRAVRDAVADVEGAVVVAGAYADARRVAHAPLAPELLPRVARAAGVGICLLDTAIKDGRGLLDWLSPDALAALVAEAHAAGLQVALAGALRAQTCPWSAGPAPISPVCARRCAATAGARRRSSRSASVRWWPRLGERRPATIEGGEVASRRCVASVIGPVRGTGSRNLVQGYRQLRSRTKDTPVHFGHP